MSNRFYIFIAILLMAFPILSFDVNATKNLPVMHQGRLKPMDSAARAILRSFYSQETILFEGNKISALEWMWMMMSCTQKANTLDLFKLHHQDSITTLSLNPEKKRFSFNDLSSHEEQIFQIAQDAQKISSKSAFQQEMIHLSQLIQQYHQLQNSLHIEYCEHPSQEFLYYCALLAIPHLTAEESEHLNMIQQRLHYSADLTLLFPLFPYENTDWLSTSEAALKVETEPLHPSLYSYLILSESFLKNNHEEFSKHTQSLKEQLVTYKVSTNRIDFEVLFNSIAPFDIALLCYGVSLCLILCQWITNLHKLSSLSFLCCALGLFVHTLGIIARIYIEGRPPVTNLYSSCLFVGWIACCFSLLLEKKFKDCIGVACGSFTGLLTLWIARYLNFQGDSLEAIRAVLDSNFWLSTHVICITIGYGCTYLSGFIANFYLFKSLCSKHPLSLNNIKLFHHMIYANIFFSFIGTLLGGIWADQAWGRFWGWDPKENGALLIVIWNAIIIHALKLKMISSRGTLYLLALGNIVTSLCWFGVNMLGVGLHSYGFTDESFIALFSFIGIQFLLVILHLMAKKKFTLDP